MKKWTKSKIDETIRSIIEENGLLPTRKFYKENGLGGFLSTIEAEYGGLNKIRKKYGVYNLKKCKICLEIKDLSSFRSCTKNKYEKFKTNICKECSAKMVEDYRNTWPGIAAEMTRRARHRAKKNNLEFTIDKNWVLSIIEEYDFHCSATGVALTGPKNNKDRSGHGFARRYSPSLDRIDSSLGYTKENTRIVCNWFNWCKSCYSDDECEEFFMKFINKRGGCQDG